ncbi:MAG TPA: hypothetical protein VGR41_01995 [Actinomycetota bacterium]|jgi:hypothetical protein|nr:hypothetical protein [Actinomycetota bacterium]
MTDEEELTEEEEEHKRRVAYVRPGPFTTTRMYSATGSESTSGSAEGHPCADGDKGPSYPTK